MSAQDLVLISHSPRGKGKGCLGVSLVLPQLPIQHRLRYSRKYAVGRSPRIALPSDSDLHGESVALSRGEQAQGCSEVSKGFDEELRHVPCCLCLSRPQLSTCLDQRHCRKQHIPTMQPLSVM